MNYYTEDEARKLVIEAGHRLVAERLIARTWGNISARISRTQFVITPSGLAYESLKPEDLVLVTMRTNEPATRRQTSDTSADKAQKGTASWFTGELTYEGARKPSSEKGVHAESYALRDDVTFIIHTHQHYACVVSAQECSIDAAYTDGLGHVPCAFYALSGTKSLREAVKMSVKANPESQAFIMARHGAVLLGKSYEEAFEIATRLENVCEKIVNSRLKARAEILGEKAGERAPEIGVASAVGSDSFDISKLSNKELKKIFQSWLDDYAQIVGGNGKKYAKLLGIPDGKPVGGGEGAESEAFEPRDKGTERLEDAEAIRMIMSKNAAAALFVDEKTKPLGFFDRTLQRLVYKLKYSKKKDS